MDSNQQHGINSANEEPKKSTLKWSDEDIVRFGEEYRIAYEQERVGSAVAFLDTFNTPAEPKPVLINGHIVDANAPINQDDVIIRRSNGEISIANDEWDNDLHDDWIKIISPIDEDKYKALYDRLFK